MPVGLGFALEGSREHAEQRSQAVTHGPRPVCRCILLGLHGVFGKKKSFSKLSEFKNRESSPKKVQISIF